MTPGTIPLISIITPSFNQARFLRRTIDSVLAQDYPHVECIVIDGGSTDDSIAVLRSYGDRIRWIAEPDRGQSDAINKGFARCHGAIRAYLNSDDVLWPGALRTVQGEELLRSWQPEDGNPKVFCSVCGSHMWAEDRSSPGVYFVRLGSFDTDPGVRPSHRQFVAYAAAWEPIPDDGLPRYSERRPPNA